jgi:hypothetical protein
MNKHPELNSTTIVKPAKEVVIPPDLDRPVQALIQAAILLNQLGLPNVWLRGITGQADMKLLSSITPPQEVMTPENIAKVLTTALGVGVIDYQSRHEFQTVARLLAFADNELRRLGFQENENDRFTEFHKQLEAAYGVDLSFGSVAQVAQEMAPLVKTSEILRRLELEAGIAEENELLSIYGYRVTTISDSDDEDAMAVIVEEKDGHPVKNPELIRGINFKSEEELRSRFKYQEEWFDELHRAVLAWLRTCTDPRIKNVL